MSKLHRLSRRAACALALCAVAPGAPAQETAGVAVHHLSVAGADFGTATLRERQTGLRGWTRAFGYDAFDFRVAADYAYTRYEFDGLPTRDRDLHHVHVPLQWRARDDAWLVELTPLVATSSNVFKDLVNRADGDDFDLYVRLQAQRWSDAQRGWRAALVRDAAFGRPLVYPELAFLWRGPALAAELGLPRARLEWQARTDLHLGAAVFPAGAQWHVVSDERDGAEFDYRARQWRGALTAAWQPWQRLRVAAQAGIEFARHYEFEDDTGAAIRRDARSAPYLRIDLVFAL